MLRNSYNVCFASFRNCISLYGRIQPLKILKATFLDGEWTNIEEFPYNSDDFSNAHPSLSRDGKTLYFSSDRPGGFGATDLYMSTWDGSKWGEPV